MRGRPRAGDQRSGVVLANQGQNHLPLTDDRTCKPNPLAVDHPVEPHRPRLIARPRNHRVCHACTSARPRAELRYFFFEMVTIGTERRCVRRRRSAKPGRAASAAPRGRKKGSKRTPEELGALVKQLHSHITKNPGQRIEQIGKTLGISTKEFVLPIKKLVSEKKVSTKGAKRATTDFAK